MTCPNCEMPVKRGSLCTHCGTDSVILKKTIKLSGAMYNKGLAEVKSGNLCSAIESLNKSVSYNRNNTASRNLLGLVYFRYGRVADSCKHWIISAHLVKNDNPANKYLNMLQENMDVLERYGAAIERYNEALLYVKQRNVEMAIDELKNAIDLNPGLIDALNLLAMCYLIVKDKELASQAVLKVLSIDAGNSIALNYYKKINPVGSRQEARAPVRQPQPRAPVPTPAPYVYGRPRKSFSPFHLVSLLLFVVGAVVMYTFLAVFVIPSMIEDATNETETLKTRLTEYTATTEARLTELEAENERLIVLADEAAGDKDDMSADLIRERKINRINEAYNLLRENKIEDAADALYQVDATGLPLTAVELYDNMVKETVFPAAAQQLHASGIQQYNAGDYNEAKRLLEKALRYVSEGSMSKAEVIYYLGLTSQNLEEYAAAAGYYRDVVDNYPNAAPNVRDTAQSRLDMLSEQMEGDV